MATVTPDEQKKDNALVRKLKGIHPFIYMCIIMALCILAMPGNGATSKAIRGAKSENEMKFDIVPFVKGHIGNAESALQDKPAMYTFFARIHPNNKITGMRDEDDTVLLQEWTEKWAAAGWEPEILTLKHAKKHPRYEEFLTKLQQVPLNQKNRVYNEICFLRWLAMSAVGGGWMSDYDIFPLGTGSGTDSFQAVELPNEGEFTVYSIIPGSRGAGIPCLMSGSGEEWTRMGFEVLENAISKNGKEPHWTDMFALMDLRWGGGMFKYGDEVVAGDNMLLGRGWEPSDCSKTEGKRAIHFSHSAMKNGIMDNIEGASNHVADRPLVLDHWLKMWNQVCTHA